MGLFEGVRAVQWNGSYGHVEYDDGTNAPLDRIDAFQPFIDLWNAPPPVVIPPTAAELKAATLARINAAYEMAIRSITAGYPEGEVASWPKQESEARAYLKDEAAFTPWLDAAADARGISKPDLVAKIIANSHLFSAASGQLSGKRQKLRDQIAALEDNPTQAQLEAIQW